MSVKYFLTNIYSSSKMRSYLFGRLNSYLHPLSPSAQPVLQSPYLAKFTLPPTLTSHPHFPSTTSNHFPSLPSLFWLASFSKRAFVIGWYLYQLGPSATWDNGLQSDPGHIKQNCSLAPLWSVQSSPVRSSPSATQACYTDRETDRATAPIHTLTHSLR